MSLQTASQNQEAEEAKVLVSNQIKLIVIGRANRYGTIAELAEKDPPPSWAQIFRFSLPEIQHASQIAHSLGEFFPYPDEVFTAFDRCPFPPKIVIVGQDPYHSIENGRPQACGMSFATRRGCPLQPSVRNIYNEIMNEIPSFRMPSHGDLTEWAEQGILLLNTCLTVMPHQPKSHMMKNLTGKGSDGTNIWSGFIDKVLAAIAEVNPQCIYLLWGADAQKLMPNLNQRSIKLVSSHPSPFSASRSSKDVPSFFGSGHFVLVNHYLIQQGKQPINWQIS